MEKTKKEKRNPNDIVAYRKSKKRKNTLYKFLILIIVTIGIFVFTINFDAIVEPLRGIASKIDTKTSTDVGYPIKLPGSATYSFSEFGENFLLLTDTYLYTFSENGGQNYALRHGYTNAVARSNSKRILLYDKDYYKFSLYSKTNKIFESETEDKIVYSALSDNDMSAIVTTSSRYSNIIYVYNDNGEKKYTRKLVDENVMQIAFSDDERYIYVATLGVDNGDIYSALYKYDIGSEADAVWRCKFDRSSIPCEINCAGKAVTIAFDDSCTAVSEEDGSVVSSYNYSGTMLDVDFADGMTALLYSQSSTNRTILATLDNECNVIQSCAVNVNINDVEADDNEAYVIVGGALVGYDSELNQIKSIELQDEYSAFIKIGSSAYLLGYDAVDMERL